MSFLLRSSIQIAKRVRKFYIVTINEIQKPNLLKAVLKFPTPTEGDPDWLDFMTYLQLGIIAYFWDEGFRGTKSCDCAIRVMGPTAEEESPRWFAKADTPIDEWVKSPNKKLSSDFIDRRS